MSKMAWPGRKDRPLLFGLFEGWTRSDEIQPDRSALREQLWDAVRLCHAPVVAGPSALLTAWGDSNWWAWRDLVARTDAGLADHPSPWVTYVERT